MLFSLPPLPPLRLRGSPLGSLQSHAARYSGRTGKNACRIEGKSSPIKCFETETSPTRGLLSLLLVAILINSGISNPYQPFKITWKLSDGQTHEVINKTSGIHPLNTWWPDLYFNLRRLCTLGRATHFAIWKPGWTYGGCICPHLWSGGPSWVFRLPRQH